MATRLEVPYLSEEQKNEAYWIVIYYPLLIILFSLLCQVDLEQLGKNLPQAPTDSASTNVTNMTPRAPAQRQKTNAMTMGREDVEENSASAEDPAAAQEKSGSSERNRDHETVSEHGNELVTNPGVSTRTLLVRATIWQTLQLYLMQRMGFLAAKFVRETGYSISPALLMLGVVTYMVLLSLGEFNLRWPSVKAGYRVTKKEDLKTKKLELFDFLFISAMLSLFVPWYLIVTAAYW